MKYLFWDFSKNKGFNWKFVLRFNLILFSVLFLFSETAFSYSECLLNESFDDYISLSNMLSSSDWEAGEGTPANTHYIVDLGGDKELRINESTGASNGVSIGLYPINETDYFNCVNQTMVIEFDLTTSTLTGAGNQNFLEINNVSAQIQTIGGIANDGVDVALDSIIGAGKLYDFSLGQEDHIKITLSADADATKCLFAWYRNNNLLATGTRDTLYNFSIQIVSGNNQITDLLADIDNLIVYTNDGTATFTNWCTQGIFSGNASLDLGEPCQSSDDCTTGKCKGGMCVFKLFKEYCDNSYECLSQNCVNGQCTDAGLWAKLTATKKENFGDDTNTNNFISLFIILGGALAFIIGGKGHIAAIVGGIAFILASAIFFTIVGWLSPFILFGIFLIIAVMGFLVWVIVGGSN